MTSQTLLQGLIAASLLCEIISQPAAGQGGGAFGGGGGVQLDARQSYLARYKTTVGFTDEEWIVVAPKILRVLQLQIEAGSGPLGMQAFQQQTGAGGLGGGRGGGRTGNTLRALGTGQPSLAAQKRQAMQEALADTDIAQRTIALKMEEFRSAVKKAREDLLKAQQDLQGVLTIRQESVLVQMGVLD